MNKYKRLGRKDILKLKVYKNIQKLTGKSLKWTLVCSGIFLVFIIGVVMFYKVVDSNSFIKTGGDSGNGSVRSSAGNDASGIPAGTTYVVNKNSGKFHYPACDSVKDMKEKNKEYSSKTRDELISEGKSPCGRCHP